MFWKQYDDGRPQPGEGTELPTWYDLHHHDIAVAIAVLGIVALIAALWRYRANITALLNRIASALIGTDG